MIHQFDTTRGTFDIGRLDTTLRVIAKIKVKIEILENNQTAQNLW